MATIKKISNCGQTIPLVCAVLRYVLENLHMPHVLHTTALAKVTLNRTHTTGWAPAKFGISPISRKLSWGNSAANAKGGMLFGIFGFFSHTLKYHILVLCNREKPRLQTPKRPEGNAEKEWEPNPFGVTCQL